MSAGEDDGPRGRVGPGVTDPDAASWPPIPGCDRGRPVRARPEDDVPSQPSWLALGLDRSERTPGPPWTTRLGPGAGAVHREAVERGEDPDRPGGTTRPGRSSRTDSKPLGDRGAQSSISGAGARDEYRVPATPEQVRCAGDVKSNRSPLSRPTFMMWFPAASYAASSGGARSRAARRRVLAGSAARPRVERPQVGTHFAELGPPSRCPRRGPWRARSIIGPSFA